MSDTSSSKTFQRTSLLQNIPCQLFTLLTVRVGTLAFLWNLLLIESLPLVAIAVIFFQETVYLFLKS